MSSGTAKNITVVAHPDDETLWGGGILEEEDCLVVCLTSGNNITRRNKFNAVMDVWEAQGLILDFPDYSGGLFSRNEEIEIAIILEPIINARSVEKVITHSPYGEYGP